MKKLISVLLALSMLLFAFSAFAEDVTTQETPPEPPEGFNGSNPPEPPEGFNGGTPPEPPEGFDGSTPPEPPEGFDGSTPPERPEGSGSRVFQPICGIFRPS